MRFDCHNSHARRLRSACGLLVLLFVLGISSSAFALAPTGQEAAPHATPAAQAEGHAPAEGEHEGGMLPMIAKLVNFGILVFVLYRFLNVPIATYLANRSTQIQQDLVTAKETREAATAQLAEIEQKLKSLPAELEALKRQGAEDVRAEQARITKAAVVERERLLEQTRREIDMRLRVARRELTEHAAELAVGVAEQRIKRTITPDDQTRLVDRYTAQLQQEAR